MQNIQPTQAELRERAYLARPGECGGCWAKIKLPKERQIECSTSLAPSFTKHVGGLLIAQVRCGKKTPSNPSGRFRLVKIRTVEIEPPPYDGKFGRAVEAQPSAPPLISLSTDKGASWKPVPNGVNRVGSFLRSYALDEIPQILQWLWPGQLKLVGVRPYPVASASLLPKERLARLQTHKPGLMNILYASRLGEIHNEETRAVAEQKYLDAYEAQPFLTDAKYFFTILNNTMRRWIPILQKKARNGAEQVSPIS